MWCCLLCLSRWAGLCLPARGQSWNWWFYICWVNLIMLTSFFLILCNAHFTCGSADNILVLDTFYSHRCKRLVSLVRCMGCCYGSKASPGGESMTRLVTLSWTTWVICTPGKITGVHPSFCPVYPNLTPVCEWRQGMAVWRTCGCFKTSTTSWLKNSLTVPAPLWILWWQPFVILSDR